MRRISSLLLTLSSAFLSGNIMAKDTFTAMPFGAIKPTGWLQQQMLQDVETGFVGHLDKLVPDLIYEDDIYGANRLTKLVKAKDVGTHNSGEEWEVQFLWWNSETQSNWWDGYIRNVFLLEHPSLGKRVTDYVNAKLATADPDGYIGIYGTDLRYKHTTENGELWAQSSLFRGLLAYYEATGEIQVLDAVKKAVAVTMQHYPMGQSTPFKTENAFAGVGHGLTFVDVLNTLFRLTQDSTYLDYAVFLYDDYSAHPQPEEDVQLTNLFDADYKFKGHGVHTYEHLRALTIAATHSDEDKYSKALARFLERLEDVVTASGGPIGDEWIAGRHAHHSDTGYEYCSLQELLHSYGVLLQKTGDSRWADKMEWLIYNAGQGARHPNGKSIAYCQTDNSVDVLGHLDMNNPQGEMRFKYSPAHQDVAVCCAPNAGRIYPYFVQNAWQETPSGVVANLYAPTVLTVSIKDVAVTIEQVTQYPFEHSVEFIISTEKPVEFELLLRQPQWADTVNLFDSDGTAIAHTQDSEYLSLNKRWQGTESIKLDFTAQPKVVPHANNTAGVHYGPLLYALSLEHQESRGRNYPLEGFHDQFFKGFDGADEHYQLALDSKFKVARAPSDGIWAGSDMLQGHMYDPKTSTSSAVDLVPIGATILRKVSFDLVSHNASKSVVETRAASTASSAGTGD